MKNNILSVNLDKQPYTGEIAIKGKLRIKNVSYLKGFFDGSKGYEQVKNVTMGKVYNVVKKEGFGDGEDITFINDIGEEQTLGDYFFEEV